MYVLAVVVVGAAVAGCTHGDAGEEAAVSPPPVVSSAPVDPPSQELSPSPEPSQTSRTATLSPEQVGWVEQARPVVDEFYAAWAEVQQQPSGDVVAVRFGLHDVAREDAALAVARQVAGIAERGNRVEGTWVLTNVQFLNAFVDGEPGRPTVQFDFCVNLGDSRVITSDGRELPPFGDGGEDDVLPDRRPSRVWVQDVGPAEVPGLPQGWVVASVIDESSESWTESEVDPCDVG